MDKDFHYYGIGFIARAAGFNKQDALTIAYASQYVDNSTESEPIRVGDRFFDPVRTAHNGLKAFNWGVQKRVYIPFHFIPPNPFMASPESFTFITTPDSPFAGMIFENACREPDELSRLISIGIALHTLADTWAHRGFSGREEPANDVEAIFQYKNGSWKRLILPNIYLDILPKAGHAQAGHFPDLPYLRWKYTRSATKERIELDNLTDFLHAAQKIHQLLLTVNKTDPASVIPWEEIKAPIREIFIYPEPDADKRCRKWQDYFRKVFGENSGYKYDAKQWRKEALIPQNEKDVAWDQYEPSDFKKLTFSMTSGFYNTPWVKFHRAALRQRNFVLEHII
jgi:hypothetical protein